MIYTIRYPQDEGKRFQMFRYPGGEVQVRLLADQVAEIAEADEVHVWATIRDGALMGLAQLTDAIQTLIPPLMTLFLPYLPYGRADRRFVVGDCFGLYVFAEQINALDYDKVVTLDAHSDIAEIEISNLVNVSPLPIIQTVLDVLDGEEVGGVLSTAVLLPDDGASRYNLQTALRASKKRDLETGKLTGFTVPAKEEFQADSILIVDDICDGGGTFVGIAEQLKNCGLPMYLYVSHGIFSKGLTDLFKYFAKIYTTDSFGTSVHAAPEEAHRLVTFPCGGLLLDAVLTRSQLWRNATK